MSILDKALADMRAGLTVLLVVSHADAVRPLLDEAVPLIIDGEQIRRANGAARIEARGHSGRIIVRPYTSAGNMRGWCFDRTYFDHRGIHQRLAPMLVMSKLDTRIVHGPA